jgi:hypothetical protein
MSSSIIHRMIYLFKHKESIIGGVLVSFDDSPVWSSSHSYISQSPYDSSQPVPKSVSITSYRSMYALHNFQVSETEILSQALFIVRALKSI